MKYEILGNPFSVVTCNLSSGESVVCQKGAMTWMSDNMKMETGTGGGLGKVFSKALSGESIFQNTYTAVGAPGSITFGASLPGSILAFQISQACSIIAQKCAFLASEPTVNFEIFFQKKIASGFFGGEGFIMQRFTGDGMLFVEIDGSVIEKNLAAGESMLIDTGYLAAMDSSVSLSIDTVKGIGNALFGGEGLFNTRVTGPGRIWLQTMPIANLAGSIYHYIPKK